MGILDREYMRNEDEAKMTRCPFCKNKLHGTTEVYCANCNKVVRPITEEDLLTEDTPSNSSRVTKAILYVAVILIVIAMILLM